MLELRAALLTVMKKKNIPFQAGAYSLPLSSST
jgi:hypothetical protein